MSCCCDDPTLGGGGGGAVDSVTGTNGLVAAPSIGFVSISGLALYARNASNGAMTADIACGGFQVANTPRVYSNGTLTLSSGASSDLLLGAASGAITGGSIIGTCGTGQFPGSARFTAGTALAGALSGGLFQGFGGSGGGLAAGGDAVVAAGEGGAGQDGGSLNLYAGQADTGTQGAAANLTGGANVGTGPGGTMFASGGISSGGGAGGIALVKGGDSVSVGAVSGGLYAGSGENLSGGPTSIAEFYTGSTSGGAATGLAGELRMSGGDGWLGGMVNLYSGAGTNGHGDINISAGHPSFFANAGLGNVLIQAGPAVGPSGPGDITFRTLNGSGPGATLGNGGDFFHISGTGGDGRGGNYTYTAGNGGAGAGGSFAYTAGNGGGGVGGSFTITAGNGGFGQNCGNISLIGGQVASGQCTNIILQAGEFVGNPAGLGAVIVKGSATVTCAIFKALSASDFTTAATFSVLRKNLAGDSLEYAPQVVVTNFSAGPTTTVSQLNEGNAVLALNVSAGAIACILPGGAVAGARVVIKDRYNGGSQAATNNITVSFTGGETVDGAASQLIATNLGSMTLVKGLAADWMMI